jgi:hypothetical protein
MLSDLADLEHHLDLALKGSAHDLTSGEKTELLDAVSRVRNKLDALDAAAITAFEATQEHKAQGHASVIGWLAHNRRESNDTAAGRRRLARRLLHHPLAADALAAGEITAAHIDQMDRARRRLGDETYLDYAQPLVEVAVAQRFSDFARTIDYLIMRCDPGEDPDQRQHRDRWANASATFEGAGAIDAWLPKLDFQEWQAEFDRLVDHLYTQDLAEARARLGREPERSELRQTNPQRRAEAMVLMARRSANFTGDDLGSRRYVTHIHADATLVACLVKVLTDALADPDLDLDQAVAGIELGRDSLHELADGTPISVNTLMLALLTGTVRGYWHDPDGVPLRHGRDRRLFTPNQATTLLTRHRRCAHPYGCDRTTRLQSNHITEWQRGGPTDIDHADTRCGPHNRWHTTTYDDPDPPGHHDTSHHRTPPPLGPHPTHGDDDQAA